MKGKGDTLEKEIEALFKEHYSFLCLVAYGILRERDVAKDIVQDFFVSYWQNKRTISVPFRAYAGKAVKNLCLIHLEKVKKEKIRLRTVDVPQYEEQRIPENTKRDATLKALLERLPERRRNIFVSAVINGQSYSEIAESNDISVNTVKTQIKRAYAFLRAEIPEDLYYVILLISYNIF